MASSLSLTLTANCDCPATLACLQGADAELQGLTSPGRPLSHVFSNRAGHHKGTLQLWVSHTAFHLCSDACRALTLSRRGFRVLEVLHRVGAKPNAPVPEPLSFWVTSLIPLGTEDRLRLLNLTSTPDRITFARSKLEGMVSGGGLSPLQSCSIM